VNNFVRVPTLSVLSLWLSNVR